jgi:hypothetical protein
MPARFRLSRRASPSRSPFSISESFQVASRGSWGFELLAPPTKVYSPECVEGASLLKKSL